MNEYIQNKHGIINFKPQKYQFFTVKYDTEKIEKFEKVVIKDLNENGREFSLLSF